MLFENEKMIHLTFGGQGMDDLEIQETSKGGLCQGSKI